MLKMMYNVLMFNPLVFLALRIDRVTIRLRV